MRSRRARQGQGPTWPDEGRWVALLWMFLPPGPRYSGGAVWGRGLPRAQQYIWTLARRALRVGNPASSRGGPSAASGRTGCGGASLARATGVRRRTAPLRRRRGSLARRCAAPPRRVVGSGQAGPAQTTARAQTSAHHHRHRHRHHLKQTPEQHTEVVPKADGETSRDRNNPQFQPPRTNQQGTQQGAKQWGTAKVTAARVSVFNHRAIAAQANSTPTATAAVTCAA